MTIRAPEDLHRIRPSNSGPISLLLSFCLAAGVACASGSTAAPAGQPWATADALPQGVALDRLARQIVDSLGERQKRAVAVVGFSDESGVESRFGRFLAEELTTRLFVAKRFVVVERSMLRRVLQEQKLQVGSSLIDPTSAKEIGRLLGVDAIATGTFTDLGDSARINARVIGTQDGMVFAAAAVSILSDDAIRNLMADTTDISQGTDQAQGTDPARAAVRAGFHSIRSTCANTVRSDASGYTLGNGWCFYLVEPDPPAADYAVTFRARLRNGSGYGFWFDGQWDSGRVSAMGIQYDPDAGGIKFLRYPETESDYRPRASFAMDNNWHVWRLQRRGNREKVWIDGQLLVDATPLSPNHSIGFRTWRGIVEIAGLTISR